METVLQKQAVMFHSTFKTKGKLRNNQLFVTII